MTTATIPWTLSGFTIRTNVPEKRNKGIKYPWFDTVTRLSNECTCSSIVWSKNQNATLVKRY